MAKRSSSRAKGKSIIPATNPNHLPLSFDGQVVHDNNEGQDPLASITNTEIVLPNQPDKEVAQVNTTAGITNSENVILPADAAAPPPVPLGAEGLPVVRARPGESRHAAWERIRQEARTAGMPRGQGPGTAYEYATLAVQQLFQPAPEPAAVDPEPIEEPPASEPEPAPVAEPAAAETPEPIASDPAPEAAAGEGLAGLGAIPADWPDLPDNAALPVEVQWVQANRVRVRVGDAVDLSRARTPAPSAAALAWLETALLFPAKWADITAKATSAQVDDAAHAKHERLALHAVGELLGSMSDALPST